MKPLSIGAVFAGAALAALACRGDPTSSLRGGAKSIDMTSNVVFIDAGDARQLEVVVRDEQLNPLVADVTVASLNPSVVTIAVDTTIPVANGATHHYTITAVAPGLTKITVQSSGLADSVIVSVLPVNFAGALSSVTPKGGDTVSIFSTSLFKFDPDSAALVFGHSFFTLKRNADTITFLMPFTTTTADSISHVAVTYVPGLHVTLPLATPPVQTGSLWSPADTGYATAPQIALPTVTGQSTVFIANGVSQNNDADCGEGTGAGGIGNCLIFKYVATGTDSLSFSVDWEGAALAPDMDIYSCGSAGVSACFEDNGSGATGSKPQVFRLKPTAGTHYYVIEVYGGSPPANIYTTITKLN